MTPSGAFLGSNVVATTPIFSAPGVVAGYTRSIVEVGANSTETVYSLDAQGQIVQTRTASSDPSVPTTVTRAGITIETTTAGVFAKVPGVEAAIPVASDGSFAVPTASGSVTIRFSSDPLAGGIATAGGTNYSFRAGEALGISSGHLSLVDNPYGSANSTERVINSSTGAGTQYDYQQGPQGAYVGRLDH